MKYFLILFSVSILWSEITFCQTDPCDMNYKDGKSVYRTRMVGIHENLLLISDTGSYKIVNVDKIAKIRFNNGTFWKTGAAFGSAIGFVGGFLVYTIWG
ncbi:MAG TPA: hypothetical protein VGK25_00925, partial [Ignavibacteria bacterium]